MSWGEKTDDTGQSDPLRQPVRAARPPRLVPQGQRVSRLQGTQGTRSPPPRPRPYRVAARREGDGLHVVVGNDLARERHAQSRGRSRLFTRPGPQGGPREGGVGSGHRGPGGRRGGEPPPRPSAEAAASLTHAHSRGPDTHTQGLTLRPTLPRTGPPTLNAQKHNQSHRPPDTLEPVFTPWHITCPLTRTLRCGTLTWHTQWSHAGVRPARGPSLQTAPCARLHAHLYSFAHLRAHLFTCSFTCSFIHLLICIRALTYTHIHSLQACLVCTFAHLFPRSFVCLHHSPAPEWTCCCMSHTAAEAPPRAPSFAPSQPHVTALPRVTALSGHIPASPHGPH